MHKLRVLICDDMAHVRAAHEQHVRDCGEDIFFPSVEEADSVDAGKKAVIQSIEAESPFDIAFLDIDYSKALRNDGSDGFEIANFIHKISPSTTIVMVSSYSSDENLKIAEQSPYVHRFFRREEFTPQELKKVCIYALLKKLHHRRELLPPQDISYTRSPIMEGYLQKVDQIGPGENVVIYGETGTGKELTAKRLNVNAMVGMGLKTRPLVMINCGGITETLQTTEFFGYVRGAFTGANRDTPGLLEKAEGGDLFLDELQNAPKKLQELLMRVLQDKEFTPVGGTIPKRLNVRFISALNKNPIEAKKSGTIMTDLLARIQQEYLVIPALRERKGDIPALVEYFLCQDGKADKRFSADAISFLEQAAWPTNVRGLRNVVLEAVRHSKTPVINREGLLRLSSVQEMLEEAAPVSAPNLGLARNPNSQVLDVKVEDLVAAWFETDESLDQPLRRVEGRILESRWLIRLEDGVSRLQDGRKQFHCGRR